MERDKVDPALLFANSTADTSSNAGEAEKTNNSNSDPKYEKYKKMQTAGVPEGAIRLAMMRDGVDPKPFFNAEYEKPKHNSRSTG